MEGLVRLELTTLGSASLRSKSELSYSPFINLRCVLEEGAGVEPTGVFQVSDGF
jgi:hypothetical protein